MLKTITEIKELSPDGIDEYSRILHEVYGLPHEEAVAVTTSIVDTPMNAVPMSDNMLLYFVLFLNRTWDENTILRFMPGPFTLDNVCAISLRHGGNSSILYISGYEDSFIQNFYSRLRTGGIGYQNLFYERFGEPSPQLPPLTSFTEEEVSYMQRLGIIIHPEYLEPNSKSIEVKENTARFSGAMWYEAIQAKVITLAGVGGIGSYVGFMLARMNPKSIFVYDDDRVEAVNMSGQFYGRSDIGNYKADALANAVRNYSDYYSIFSITQRFTLETSASDIMICGFDNMEARRMFFTKWFNHVASKSEEEKRHCLFIDGRLAAEDLQVLCITGDNAPGIGRYSQEFLFSDEEADETVCSYKQTTYMANMIGSIIVNLFTNFVANELVGAPIRSLPFFTSYDGVSMRIKNE